MNSFKKAIWDNYITGYSPWYYKAPETQVLPYTVWQFISVVPEDTFTEELSDIEIQFNIFSKNHAESDQIADSIVEHYENTTLLIGEIEVNLCLTIRLPAVENEGVWQTTLSFQAYLGE